MCCLCLQKTAQAPFGLRFNLLDSRELRFRAPQLLQAVFWGSNREQGEALMSEELPQRGCGIPGHKAKSLAALGERICSVTAIVPLLIMPVPEHLPKDCWVLHSWVWVSASPGQASVVLSLRQSTARREMLQHFRLPHSSQLA